jgi:hypothetical protein
MSFPIIQPSPRWYWTVPFNSGAWDAVSSLNPFSGPETGSAASSANASQYLYLQDQAWTLQAFLFGCCWDADYFWTANFDAEAALDMYRTDRFICTEPALQWSVTTEGFGVHLLAYPEDDYLLSISGPGPLSNKYVFRRLKMDGSENDDIADVDYASDADIASMGAGTTETRHTIDFICSDRVNFRAYSKESVATYSRAGGSGTGPGTLTDLKERIVRTDIVDGDRAVLYENDIAPTQTKRLWHPTYDYTDDRVLVPEEEITGANFTPGFDQVNILAITPAGVDTVLFSYEPASADDGGGDFFPTASPIIAWTSSLSQKLYHTKSPLGGKTRTDSDVGLFQYELDGTNEQRLCNDPREQNFEWSDTADARTVLGPGTRATWEL